MILFVDDENKVRAVNTTTDSSLTPLYVDETNETFPFKGWSTAKICCYKVNVVDGIVTMYTPYVDSKLLDLIDNLGHKLDELTPYKESKVAYYGETEKTFYNVPSGNVSVFFDDFNIQYSVQRIEDRLIVAFEPLKQETKITISIQ